MKYRREMNDRILGLLGASQEGLSAAEIRARLPERISQPTLSRYLQKLRARGLVNIEGKARATRYHMAEPGRLAALRSRALHEAIATRIAQDPGLLGQVRNRLNRLRQVNPHGRRYHEQWSAILQGPLPRLLRVMTEDSEEAADLRRESPFTVLADPETRRRVFERFDAR